MLEHIGDCIHDFSLKALPWAASTDVHKDMIDDMVSKWLDTIEWPYVAENSLVLRFFSSEAQTPAADGWPEITEYFAESSENSSRVERGPAPWDPDLPQLDFSSTSVPAPSETQRSPPEIMGTRTNDDSGIIDTGRTGREVHTSAESISQSQGSKAKAETATEKKEKLPIKFKDAVGRRFTFPFHICQTWQVCFP
jgi:hypothetical protein